MHGGSVGGGLGIVESISARVGRGGAKRRWRALQLQLNDRELLAGKDSSENSEWKREKASEQKQERKQQKTTTSTMTTKRANERARSTRGRR